mmetsp:Transcript_26799/g.52049  ORF Transcript_26799/g.52049 Transcript_26799/m.52049 type:complete len:226 (-) Transcript_26799:68-745(-)
MRLCKKRPATRRHSDRAVRIVPWELIHAKRHGSELSSWAGSVPTWPFQISSSHATWPRYHKAYTLRVASLQSAARPCVHLAKLPFRAAKLGRSLTVLTRARSSLCGPRHVCAVDHDGVLRMHPVLGLAEDVRLRALDHAVGHLAPALRRQAVQEDGLLLPGRRHQLLIHLVGHEDLLPGLGLFLLLHRCPHVRVDDVGVLHRRDRVVEHGGRAEPRGLDCGDQVG